MRTDTVSPMLEISQRFQRPGGFRGVPVRRSSPLHFALPSGKIEPVVSP